MKKLDFLSPARASQFQGADSGIECGALWHDGVTLWLLSSGQTGGWSNRDLWVYDRLPGGPNADKSYSGYWAMGTISAAPLPYNLGITGAVADVTDAGFDLLRVPAGVTISATWQALPVAQIFGEVSEVTAQSAAGTPWRAQFLDAATGAVLFDGTASVGLRALPPLLDGQSAILRVRSENVARAYAWPPPNYRTVSGEGSDAPTRFAWTHSTLGTLYFDPRFGVGARPYDRSDPVQAALLDAEKTARENGTARKIAEWISYLVEFDPTGAPVGKGSEWAMVRIVAGNGAWIGDESVDAAATLPALWRMALDEQTLAPLGVPVPWVIDPTLRSIAALEVTKAGNLLLGGAIAGSSGPAPVVYEFQPGADVPGDEAATEKTRALFACECATPLGKTICSLAETRAGVRATSPCDSFLRDLNAVNLFKRLITSHPGGRNAIAWTNSSGEHFVSTTEGGDFAISKTHQAAHGYLVLDTGRGKTTGAPLAKQLDSCLATYGGRVFGVEERSESGKIGYEQSLAERLKNYQSLGASLDGAQWDALESWQVLDFDAGPVARVGSKADGAALWVFGTTGEGAAMKARALRLQGRDVTKNIDLDYFIQRVSTFQYRGEDWMVLIGLKRGANGEFGREQFVLLSKGEPARIILTWDEGKFCALKSEWEKWGIDWNTLAPFLVWTGTCWLASGTAPTGGTPYLERVIGEATICMVLHGAMPYDVEKYPGIEFESGRDCWEPKGAGNASEALDLMPEGTQVSLCVLSDYEDEIGEDGQILRGEVPAAVYNPDLRHDSLKSWQYEQLYPFALWLRVDAEEPLQLESGTTITPAIRAQLAQFDQKARIDVKRPLAIAAARRVEAVLLLAPEWALESKVLKPRG